MSLDLLGEAGFGADPLTFCSGPLCYPEMQFIETYLNK